MSTPSTTRKVNRPSLSCHKCKSRKVKCNRQVPCSACIRRGCEDECSYKSIESHGFNIGVFESHQYAITPPESLEASTSSSSSNCGGTAEYAQTHKGSRRFDYTGVNLYHSKEEYINFYEVTDVILFDQKSYQQGPLSWSFLQRKDLALGFAFEYAQAMEKRKELMDGHTAPTNETEPEFERTSGQRRDKEFNARKNILNVYAVCTDDRPALCMRIKNKLPKVSQLKFLLDTFVNEVGPFMAFLDVEAFRERVYNCLGHLDSPIDRYQYYDRNAQDDLIYAGMLLITLRLGYLALLSNGVKLSASASEDGIESKISAECREVLENPIDLSVIELAEECFKKFNLLVKPSLELLQFALMIRVYQKQAPEFGEGLDGGDSQLFTGVLIQMAVSIGLNRDPDCIPSLRRLSPEKKNIRRQIWYLLMFADVVEAYSFGNPISCQAQFYDTKVPKKIGASGGGVCVSNSLFNQSALLLTHVRDTLKHVLDITGRSKVSDLCCKMSQLELFMSEQFLPLESYFTGPTSVDSYSQKEKIYCVQISLSLKILYLSVDSNLFCHYTQIGNQELSYFYCRKLLSIQLLEFLPSIFVMITKGQDILGSSADLVIIPTLQQVTHRVFLNLLSLYIRLKFVRHSWVSMMMDPGCADAVKLCDCVLRGIDVIFNIIQAAMGKLAPRYYYAYKMGKAMKSYLETARDDAFYASYYPGAVGLRSLPFPASNLREISEIINLGLTKIYDAHKMQADLLIVLEESCSILGPTNGDCEALRNGGNTPSMKAPYSSSSDQKSSKPLEDDDIESFFARVLSEVGETRDTWSDDALNFDFFYNAQ